MTGGPSYNDLLAEVMARRQNPPESPRLAALQKRLAAKAKAKAKTKTAAAAAPPIDALQLTPPPRAVARVNPWGPLCMHPDTKEIA